MIDQYLLLLIAILLGFNFFFLIAIFRLKEKAKNIVPSLEKTVRTIDAERILHDLTSGESIVRIIPINPGDVFLRSPR